MEGQLYLPIYLLIISILCFGESLIYMSSSGYRFQTQWHPTAFGWVLCAFLTLWLGLRPVSGVFVDTTTYAYSYEYIAVKSFPTISLRSEWFWDVLTWICQKSGANVHVFFLVVEAVYIVPVMLAVKRFMPTNVTLGLLFVISSLMFYSFGVNGLRNGAACHLSLLTISLFYSDKIVRGAIVALLAFGIHRSALLPIACVFVGRYFFKNYMYAIYIWLGCIVVSLLAGNYFATLFSSIGFDNRLVHYLSSQTGGDSITGGFRVDFLLYSVPPIFFGWYVLVKRKIVDDWYKALCIAYCLCNAFWILIIRIEFTNRFAYLSWFMYPILIAYPLVNLPIWDDQDRRTGWILATYAGFTLFMWTVVW